MCALCVCLYNDAWMYGTLDPTDCVHNRMHNFPIRFLWNIIQTWCSFKSTCIHLKFITFCTNSLQFMFVIFLLLNFIDLITFTSFSRTYSSWFLLFPINLHQNMYFIIKTIQFDWSLLFFVIFFFSRHYKISIKKKILKCTINNWNKKRNTKSLWKITPFKLLVSCLVFFCLCTYTFREIIESNRLVLSQFFVLIIIFILSSQDLEFPLNPQHTAMCRIALRLLFK